MHVAMIICTFITMVLVCLPDSNSKVDLGHLVRHLGMAMLIIFGCIVIFGSLLIFEYKAVGFWSILWGISFVVVKVFRINISPLISSYLFRYRGPDVLLMMFVFVFAVSGDLSMAYVQVADSIVLFLVP